MAAEAGRLEGQACGKKPCAYDTCFLGHHDKIPLTGWLKTRDIYSFTLLDARNKNQGVDRVGLFLRL